MVVVDDHPFYRDGVVRYLVASGEVDVVAEADNGDDALALAREHEPDAVLIDLRLPKADGIAVARSLAGDGRGTRVILLSAFTEGELVYAALEAGALSYLSKEATREEILEAVLASARGESVVGAGVASGLASEIRARKAQEAAGLTPRELEILGLVAEGLSLPDIGARLHLSLSTVKTHVRHVYEKLEVSDRAAAVAEAMRAGLID